MSQPGYGIIHSNLGTERRRVYFCRRGTVNNNNLIITKTSIAPISSKRIELRGAPSGGVGQTHNPGTMNSSHKNRFVQLQREHVVVDVHPHSGSSSMTMFHKRLFDFKATCGKYWIRHVDAFLFTTLED